MTEGDRIRLKRQALGYTVYQLALAAGIAERHIHAVEAGGPLSSSNRMRLARHLVTTAAYLEHGDETVTGVLARPAMQVLIQKLERLSVAKQDKVLTIFCTSLDVK